jgi:hypothetical protein
MRRVKLRYCSKQLAQTKRFDKMPNWCDVEETPEWMPGLFFREISGLGLRRLNKALCI